jgi:hypothetical protein
VRDWRLLLIQRSSGDSSVSGTQAREIAAFAPSMSCADELRNDQL